MRTILRNVICLLLLTMGWVACNDDDDNIEVGVRPVNPVRVSEITGHNDHWGDYTLKIQYVNDKLENVSRYDKNGHRKGGLSVTKEQGVITYAVNDYVYNVDADSIARLDLSLKGKYGVGNYSLEDSIPVIARTLYKVDVTLDEESMVTQQVFSYYIPKTDFGLGDDFDNTNTLDYKETFIYEYGEGVSIVNVRSFYDTFAPDDAKNYETRTLYKYEYLHDGKRIMKNRIYQVNNYSESSWDLINDRVYTYSGNNLVSVKGDGYSLDRNYSDARTLSLNLNEEITSYVLNEYNFLIKSDNGKGEVMNVTYEPGNGNFYHMYRLDREQEGFPVIK